MTDFIPAAPGWYVLTPPSNENGEYLDPVIAWQIAEDDDGDDTLLPVVGSAPGYPPVVIRPNSFEEFTYSVTYRPNHDPATAG